MAINYKGYYKEVTKAMEKAKEKRILEATIHVRNATVKKLSGNGTGRTYRVPGTSKTYTASSPGKPPAVLFGDLRKSIQSKVIDSKGIVGSDLKKAPSLELGKRDMAARPFLRPTFTEETGEVEKILGKKWF